MTDWIPACAGMTVAAGVQVFIVLNREIHILFTKHHAAHVIGKGRGMVGNMGLAGQDIQVVSQQSVSYTHLTLPTITE